MAESPIKWIEVDETPANRGKSTTDETSTESNATIVETTVYHVAPKKSADDTQEIASVSEYSGDVTISADLQYEPFIPMPRDPYGIAASTASDPVPFDDLNSTSTVLTAATEDPRIYRETDRQVEDDRKLAAELASVSQTPAPQQQGSYPTDRKINNLEIEVNLTRVQKSADATDWSNAKTISFQPSSGKSRESSDEKSGQSIEVQQFGQSNKNDPWIEVQPNATNSEQTPNETNGQSIEVQQFNGDAQKPSNDPWIEVQQFGQSNDPWIEVQSNVEKSGQSNEDVQKPSDNPWIEVQATKKDSLNDPWIEVQSNSNQTNSGDSTNRSNQVNLGNPEINVQLNTDIQDPDSDIKIDPELHQQLYVKNKTDPSGNDLDSTCESSSIVDPDRDALDFKNIKSPDRVSVASDSTIKNLDNAFDVAPSADKPLIEDFGTLACELRRPKDVSEETFLSLDPSSRNYTIDSEGRVIFKNEEPKNPDNDLAPQISAIEFYDKTRESERRVENWIESQNLASDKGPDSQNEGQEVKDKIQNNQNLTPDKVQEIKDVQTPDNKVHEVKEDQNLTLDKAPVNQNEVQEDPSNSSLGAQTPPLDKPEVDIKPEIQKSERRVYFSENLVKKYPESPLDSKTFGADAKVVLDDGKSKGKDGVKNKEEVKDKNDSGVKNNEEVKKNDNDILKPSLQNNDSLKAEQKDEVNDNKALTEDEKAGTQTKWVDAEEPPKIPESTIDKIEQKLDQIDDNEKIGKEEATDLKTNEKSTEPREQVGGWKTQNEDKSLESKLDISNDSQQHNNKPEQIDDNEKFGKETSDLKTDVKSTEPFESSQQSNEATDLKTDLKSTESLESSQQTNKETTVSSLKLSNESALKDTEKPTESSEQVGSLETHDENKPVESQEKPTELEPSKQQINSSVDLSVHKDDQVLNSQLNEKPTEQDNNLKTQNDSTNKALDSQLNEKSTESSEQNDSKWIEEKPTESFKQDNNLKTQNEDKSADPLSTKWTEVDSVNKTLDSQQNQPSESQSEQDNNLKTQNEDKPSDSQPSQKPTEPYKSIDDSNFLAKLGTQMLDSRLIPKSIENHEQLAASSQRIAERRSAEKSTEPSDEKPKERESIVSWLIEKPKVEAGEWVAPNADLSSTPKVVEVKNDYTAKREEENEGGKEVEKEIEGRGEEKTLDSKEEEKEIAKEIQDDSNKSTDAEHVSSKTHVNDSDGKLDTPTTHENGPSTSEDKTMAVGDQDTKPAERRRSDANDEDTKDRDVNAELDAYEQKLIQNTREALALVDKLCQDTVERAERRRRHLSGGPLASSMDEEKPKIDEQQPTRRFYQTVPRPPIAEFDDLEIEVYRVNPELMEEPKSCVLLPDAKLLILDTRLGLTLMDLQSKETKRCAPADDWRDVECACYMKKHNQILVVYEQKVDDQFHKFLARFDLQLQMLTKCEAPKFILEMVVSSCRVCYVDETDSVYLAVNTPNNCFIYELNAECKWTEVHCMRGKQCADIVKMAVVGPITELLVVDSTKRHIILLGIYNSALAERAMIAFCAEPAALCVDEHENLIVFDRATNLVGVHSRLHFERIRDLIVVGRANCSLSARDGYLALLNQLKKELRICKY